MSTQTTPRTVIYPDSDGLPMSDNTLQFQWITTLVGGLQTLFRENPNVFVAGDLLWYPVEGDNTIRAAPDAMVVFGRPQGYRGSYIQFREDGIAPQVVFEVRSPGNRFGELTRKLAFYDRFGVEEYYLINPETNDLEGWQRIGGALREIAELNGWISPRLSVRFERDNTGLRIVGPDGRPFETYVELASRADDERQRAEQERQTAEQERQKAKRLEEKLRALGIDPEA